MLAFESGAICRSSSDRTMDLGTPDPPRNGGHPQGRASMWRQICSALLPWFFLARVQMAEHVRLSWRVFAPHVRHLLIVVSGLVVDGAMRFSELVALRVCCACGGLAVMTKAVMLSVFRLGARLRVPRCHASKLRRSFTPNTLSRNDRTMYPPASSLVVSLCQLQSLASSLPTEIFEGNTGHGPDLEWTTSQSGLSHRSGRGRRLVHGHQSLQRSRCAPCRTPRRSALGTRQYVRAPLGAFSQLSAFASAFLALPVTSRYASDRVFPLATISANFRACVSGK